METRNDIPNLLAMYIRNTREIYDITTWLQNCIIKKANKGIQPSIEHLANCSTMKNRKRPGNMLNISLLVCNTSFKTPIEGKIKPYIKRSKTIPIYHP